MVPVTMPGQLSINDNPVSPRWQFRPLRVLCASPRQHPQRPPPTSTSGHHRQWTPPRRPKHHHHHHHHHHHLHYHGDDTCAGRPRGAGRLPLQQGPPRPPRAVPRDPPAQAVPSLGPSQDHERFSPPPRTRPPPQLHLCRHGRRAGQPGRLPCRHPPRRLAHAHRHQPRARRALLQAVQDVPMERHQVTHCVRPGPSHRSALHPHEGGRRVEALAQDLQPRLRPEPPAHPAPGHPRQDRRLYRAPRRLRRLRRHLWPAQAPHQPHL
jgi:hypothetical protein